jgi:hypothetical protein
MRWWHARMRNIDLVILWPTCKRMAMEYHPTDAMDYARAAFAVHAFNDPAWLALGQDELMAAIDELR